ncbi:carbohydrate-binding module family 13 protein [Hydnum rufescens UP504]|uniref:Carbohydrate-binding module family 13 protein n=1 Tax=Hydnum rufescens UP504 TaxID=1448309 RepID=A0A9P6AUF4_9AGAM|nr:carbohydrate-binding module family 13 protein [Hydnum rufescens UP504]
MSREALLQISVGIRIRSGLHLFDYVSSLIVLNVHDVVGFPINKGPNEQWTLEDAGDGFFRIKNGTGKYLSFDGEAKNGTHIICNSHERTWKITQEDDHKEGATTGTPFFPFSVSFLTILHPGTNLYLELEGGKSTPRTPIRLWEKTGGKNQAWFFRSL